jgi:hypothetical protein
MTTLIYTKNMINPEKLCDEILVAVGKKLRRTDDLEVLDGNYEYLQPRLELNFIDDLSAADITTVNNTVVAHTP